MIQMFALYVAMQMVLLISGREVPDHVSGIPEINLFSRPFNPTCPAGKIGQYCGDCRTLLTCFGNGIPSNIVKCDPSLPYCVDDKCSATPPNHKDPSCEINKKFFCSVRGYVPDPDDCSVYYFCEAPQSIAVIYNCPAGYSYDANAPNAQKLCKRRRSEADCATISCSPDKDFEVYPADRSFYGYCDHITGETKVLRCGDEIYERFDPNAKSCVVTCTAEGRFPDRRHCHKYYECYFKGFKLVLQSKTCPLGMRFNPDISDCEHSIQIQDADCRPEIL